MKPLCRLLFVFCVSLLLGSCTPAKHPPSSREPLPLPLTGESPVTGQQMLPQGVDPLPEPLNQTLYVNGKALGKAYQKDGRVYACADELAAALQGQAQAREEQSPHQSVELTLSDGSSFLFATDAQESRRCLYTLEAGFLVPCDFLLSADYRLTQWDDRLLYSFVPDPQKLPKNVQVPALMYHAISNDCWGIRSLFVSPESMEEQILWLLEEGYTPIFFEDLPRADSITKPILLTFDDGYDDNYLHLFPLVQKYQVKVNIFVITDSVGGEHYLTREQILKMNESGLVSFQSHTATHPFLDELDEAALRREMTRSHQMLTQLLNREPFVLCYPSGRTSALALKVAKETYAFGLLMSGGKSYTTSDDPFRVRRDYVARSTTLSDLERMLRS